jgi:hypothetical protein
MPTLETIAEPVPHPETPPSWVRRLSVRVQCGAPQEHPSPHRKDDRLHRY